MTVYFDVTARHYEEAEVALRTASEAVAERFNMSELAALVVMLQCYLKTFRRELPSDAQPLAAEYLRILADCIMAKGPPDADPIFELMAATANRLIASTPELADETQH